MPVPASADLPADRGADPPLATLLAQRECEWIEFKRNDASPQEIGE